MKRALGMSLVFVANLIFSCAVLAQSQTPYDLAEPYLGWEQSYLRGHPALQKIMDTMVQTTARQLKEPEQDILHNRICAALVYHMAVAQGLSKDDQNLAVAGDLLHNISKEEKAAVLTAAESLAQASQMVMRLKAAGYLANSPHFWSDATVFANPKIGDNRALIHHITGAQMAGKMMVQSGEFSNKQVEKVQVAVLEHSTGYWYFRASINDVLGSAEAWRNVYPDPENDLSKLIHDADLISQFAPESVAPEGSKWRILAQKRWGAQSAAEEGQIVYYVFLRLFEEAKTDAGKRMAREKWDIIAPELVKLMNLAPGADPLAVLGVPKAFKK